MSDLIDRQQAIDALDEIEAEVADGYGYQYAKWREYFVEMPSAQPEIIRCKDCKYWTKQEDSLQGRCALLGIYPTGGWFCANADVRGEKENENNIQRIVHNNRSNGRGDQEFAESVRGIFKCSK